MNKENFINKIKSILLFFCIFIIIFGILLYFSTRDAREVSNSEKELYIEENGTLEGYKDSNPLTPYVPCAEDNEIVTNIKEEYTNEELGDVFGTMCIPDSGAATILQSSSKGETIDSGVTHTSTTNPPTMGENTVLAGHREAYFSNLYGLEVGEKVLLTVGENTYAYEVTEYKDISDTDINYVYMMDTDIRDDESYLTLYTCYPGTFYAPITGRYAVRLKLINKEYEQMIMED